MDLKTRFIAVLLSLIFIIFSFTFLQRDQQTFALEQSYESSVMLNFDSKNYIAGEKIIVNLIILDDKISFNPAKSLKVSHPIIKDNDIESYKEVFLPLKEELSSGSYQAILNTNSDDFYPGEYQFSFSYSLPDKTVYTVEKTIQVGKISISNKNLDFSLLNSKGFSSASLFLDSTFSEPKKIGLKITPRDKAFGDSKFIYDDEINVNADKDEVFIKFKIDPELFNSKKSLLENIDMNTKLEIILKTVNGQTIQKVAIPAHFEIGSYLGYHLEIFVMAITFAIILVIAAYQAWVNNQPAELFGTLICLKAKNTKNYLPKDIWHLSKFKAKEGFIGSSSKSLIHLPYLKSEAALLLAKGKKKNATIWIQPTDETVITLNNKTVTEETKLEPGNELDIDGYLLNWKY